MIGVTERTSAQSQFKLILGWTFILLKFTLRSGFPHYHCTVKKGSRVSRPQPGCHYQTELFLPRGSLVSDIPAGDGKLVNLFYGVSDHLHILKKEIFPFLQEVDLGGLHR